MDTTLEELAIELASISALPSPAIGTKVTFQLIYQDFSPKLKAIRQHQATELGSVIIGAGGSGVDLSVQDAYKARRGAKTLEKCDLFIGDFISCVILPPLHDGSVATLPDLQDVSPNAAPKISQRASSPSYYREKSPSRGRDRKKGREQRRIARMPERSRKKDEVSRRSRATKAD